MTTSPGSPRPAPAAEEAPASPDQDLRRAIREAAHWYARLHEGGRPDAGSEQEWARWHAADPAHQAAWRKVQAIHAKFDQVPGRIAGPTLNTAAASRRATLRGLLWLAAGGLGGALAYRLPWQVWQADYHTRIGERRQIILSDGSSLTLNTDSAVDVRFDADRRLVQLQAGEILIATHHDAVSMPRPFVVATRHGTALALGTRFTVRLEAERTVVSVLEHAVELQAARAPARLRLPAGQRAAISLDDVRSLGQTSAAPASWATGSFIAIDLPLAEVVAELGRYHPGFLSCDAAIAGLKISGAFPVDDTDRALAVLAESFPVRIDRLTRYWITVRPR